MKRFIADENGILIETERSTRKPRLDSDDFMIVLVIGMMFALIFGMFLLAVLKG